MEMRGGKRFTEPQLVELERKLGSALPASFRAFLRDRGTGGPVPMWYHVQDAYRHAVDFDLPEYVAVHELMIGRTVYMPKRRKTDPANGSAPTQASGIFVQIGATEFDKILLRLHDAQDAGVWFVDRDHLPIGSAVNEGLAHLLADSFESFLAGFEFPPALAGWYRPVVDDDLASFQRWVADGGEPDTAGEYAGHVFCKAIVQRSEAIAQYLFDHKYVINRIVKEQAKMCDFDLKTGKWNR